MSTITAVLEPDADGTLHLPVPEEWKAARIKVVATLEIADPESAPIRKTMQWPDFAAIQEEIFGPDLEKRRLNREDTAFILDRGEW